MTLTRFVTAAAILAVGGLATPALAQSVSASANYVISVGGINVANVAVDLSDDGARYGLDLSAQVAGLGSMVASGTAEMNSAGRSTSPQLSAEQFDLQTRANGETFDVDVSYAGSNVSAFKVEPPLIDNIDRIPIERSHLSGVTDMLSSFVFKGGQLGRDLCQRKLQVFTGVERFNINMSFAADDQATSPRTGYQGPVVLCSIKYVPISGHFTSSEITTYMAESDRILIWYAPLGQTGYFIPYRVLMGTNMGDLSMVLTQMRF